MARAFPNVHSATPETEPQARDWQALRGELVSLLDQMEGQYAHSGTTDPGLAQRVRDLRYQVVEADPDDRRREALRSVKRQIDRFNDRGEIEAAGGDQTLQSAIQQIRARASGAPAGAEAGPRYGELVQTITALNERLGQLDAELGAQRSNGPQVREIAGQVGQLSHVVELLAGAVGETGQVKRLESQIAGLASLITAGQSADMSQLSERLDQVAATVDRLADLQVQQIQHVVREAEAAPQQGVDSLKAMQAIELSVRNIYDRIDALEHNIGAPAELEQITEMLGLIGNRLASDAGGRPDRLLGLVDALNGRINEMESKGEAFAELKGDIVGLRTAVLEGIEPRFSALESRIGDLGQRIDNRAGESQGIAQVEAQIRQLVARMDQTGEQLANLFTQQAEAEQRHAATAAPDFEALAEMTAARTAEAVARSRPPAPNLNDLAERAATHAIAGMGRREAPPLDVNILADLVANRTTDALKNYSRLPTEQLEVIAELLAERTSAALAGRETAPPNFDALADLVATRTNAAMKGYVELPTERLDGIAAMVAKATAGMAARDSAPSVPPVLSTASLDEIEARVARLVDTAGMAARDAAPSVAPALSAASLDEIEARIARLVDGAATARAPEGPSPTDENLKQVEQRLKQVEATLTRRAAERDSGANGFDTPAETKAPAAAAPRETATVSPLQSAPAAAITSSTTTAHDDSMPRDPSADAPLKEFGFLDLRPVRAALEARGAPPAPSSAVPPPDAPAAAPAIAYEAAAPAPAPSFDAGSVTPPPRSRSSLDRELDSAFAAPATPAAAPVEPLPVSSRNTFIEAARRSAQRANSTQLPANPDSPIGRALSRFQTSKTETPAVPEPAPSLAAEPAPAPAKKKAPRGRLFSRRGKAPAAEAAPVAAPTAAEAPQPEAPATDELSDMSAEVRPAPQESFLSRHRRSILVTASLVAVSVMTLNLVAQRLASGDNSSVISDLVSLGSKPATAALPAQTTTAAAPALANPAAGPRIVPTASPAPATLHATSLAASAAPVGPGPRLTASSNLPPANDPMTTASLPPGGAPVANKGPLISALPAALPAAGPAASTAPVAVPGATATPGPVAAQPTPAAIESPVKVELPPDAVGPLDLRQSAANGDARSQFEIAAIYSEGRAVPQDFKQAAIWYERAAAQGFIPAQYRLGNLYETGKGLKQDYEQARLWYERAAEAGNRMAMHNLAALYAGGQFGKQDFTAAANWFQQAADLGIRDSQFNLGMLYARGLGVPQNLETAYKWFSLAAATGDSGSAKARDDIARSLDATTLKQASAEAAAWKPKTVNLVANFAPIGTWEKTFNPGPTIATKDVILKVQQALTRLGYDVGAPDGHAGPKTTVAIKAFEQGTGMTQVGAINPRLLAVLGSQPV